MLSRYTTELKWISIASASCLNFVLVKLLLLYLVNLKINKYFLILHAIDILHSDIKLNKRKYTEQQKGLKWDFQLLFSLQFY